MQQLLYKDKFFYFLCWLNFKDGFFFKLSVLRRFVTVMLKKVLLINYAFMTQYAHSYNSIVKNFFFSLFFPFKKRLKFHGLAFGADLDTSSGLLALNVGYTSTPSFFLPTYIERACLSNNRRKLLVEGRTLAVVASFVTLLRDVRPISVYYNPAKRGGRRGIRIYLAFVRRKKFNKDIK